MPSAYESYHLLRVLHSPSEVASHFIAFARVRQVKTRGLCRIGYASRHAASGGDCAASYTIRGLIANKDLPKDENVVMMPTSACLHPGVALACEPFMRIIPSDARDAYFTSAAFLQNSRVLERSLIRHNQLLLASYMAFLIMTRAFHGTGQARQERVVGAEAIAYLDFLPRSEGNFYQLSELLHGWLNTAEACRVMQQQLAENFNVTQAEVRPVLVFCLLMLYSRMVPVDHRGILQFAFKDTPVAGLVAGLPSAPAALPAESTPSTSATTALDSSAMPAASAQKLVRDPVSFMCPLIDMCNHSASENVAVAVPDRDSPSTGPLICLRTLRDVQKGEELTMTYSTMDSELKLVWGMDPILA